MSVFDVLRTVRDCLADDVVGLSAAVKALAGTGEIGADKIRTEFVFVAWKLSGAPNTTRATTTPNVMLRPMKWDPTLKRAQLRDALVRIEIGIEWFDADAQVIQDNVSLGATALARVMDGLRDYSDAHGGTVIDVLDPMEFFFGDFEGPASSGFLARIQIQERSTHE